MASNEVYALASRFLSGYGIAECKVDRCSTSLASFSYGGDVSMRLLETTDDPERALGHLSQLSWPDTRHVLFPAGDHCSALINNSRNGSDYADYTVCLARHLQTRFARVVSSLGREWSNGTEREILQYEANIFDLHDGNGELIRTVACLNDGGSWSFTASGTSHAVESAFPYDARRKRDRFTAKHLGQLIAGFGLQTVTADSFLSAGQYFLFDIPNRPAETCTIAEADDPAYAYYHRGLNWVPHMETHASSVIADFERCVRINPDYESKVRPALIEAYRVIGCR